MVASAIILELLQVPYEIGKAVIRPATCVAYCLECFGQRGALRVANQIRADQIGEVRNIEISHADTELLYFRRMVLRPKTRRQPHVHVEGFWSALPPVQGCELLPRLRRTVRTRQVRRGPEVSHGIQKKHGTSRCVPGDRAIVGLRGKTLENHPERVTLAASPLSVQQYDELLRCLEVHPPSRPGFGHPAQIEPGPVALCSYNNLSEYGRINNELTRHVLSLPIGGP